MNKDTFLWLTIGLGVGMMISAAFTYHTFIEEKKREEDPRLMKAEELLDEAEHLLKSAKNGRLAHI